jgi:hypothetical protein
VEIHACKNAKVQKNCNAAQFFLRYFYLKIAKSLKIFANVSKAGGFFVDS